jgi:NAD(P)-dependent dehydrogenase (short-subunit alcohol dehydrogenase family)
MKSDRFRCLHGIGAATSQVARPREYAMSDHSLKGKNVVVVGASRGIGREIVRRAHGEEAHVLAVARGREGLERLAQELTSVRTLALDAAQPDAPQQVFETMAPDVLVICGGAVPATAPLQELSWAQFAAPWETDVRMSFLFCGHALRTPLAPGSTVVLISSGAGLGGSPISGGYAGSKRMQMFMAAYCQKESARLGLGIRFTALVPMRIMPETELGETAVKGYARYLGIPAADFVQGMKDRQSTHQVADAVIDVATGQIGLKDAVLGVSAQGVSPVS